MRTAGYSRTISVFATWVVLILLSFPFATGALAQQFQGTITGTIRDSSGAVVKGATITATNVATKTVFNTVTNDDGVYTIPLLPIGQYEVSVTATGFQTEVQHFELHGGDRLQIDLALHIGSTSQTVNVQSEIPMLETASGDSGLTVSPAQVHDLPLLGRNPFTLVTLSPGVFVLPGQVPGNSLRPFDQGGFDSLSINGSRSQTAETTIDGLADTALDSGSATSPANIIFVPSPDMTQEFRVQTLMYDAQYGRSGGGFVAIGLKSGTNQLHGVLYDYVRNAVLNANDYADDRAGNKKPPFHWSEPGLEVDGPVYIPKLYDGRNKTFFMFGWEEIRTSTPAPVYVSVPTQLERNGDFSQSLKGSPVAIYDPLTTTQNPNGSYSRQLINPGNTSNPSLIPANRIDPVAKSIMALLPLPNLPAAGNVNNLFVGPNNVVDAYDAFTYRVDQTISPTQHIFASYLYSNRHQTQGLNGYPAAISPSYLHHRTNYGAHVNWSWIISPSFVSSFGVGWNEHRFAIVNHQPTFDLGSVGFPAYMASSPAPTLFPSITIAGYTRFGNANSGTGNLNTSDNYDLRETLIKTLARHDISFGGEIRPMRDDKQNAEGNFTLTFGTDFTQANPLAASNTSGSGFASFLLGYGDGGAASVAPAPAYKNVYYALFVQDVWRISDKFTLTAGLRWDTESPQVERHNKANIGFDPSATYTFAGQSLQGKVLFPSNGQNTAYNWDKNNFGPRVGFAWHMSQNAVLRGGYGILYSPTFDVPSTLGYSASTSYVASFNNLLTPALPTTLSNPFPQGFLQPAGPATNLNGQGGWTYWQNRTRNIPRTQQFSLGVEYQLPFRSILDVRYVGQLTSNLPISRNPNFLSVSNLALGNALNQTVANPFAGQLPGTSLNGATVSRLQTLLPFPQYVAPSSANAYSSSSFTEIFNQGTTSYNGLQVRLEKRISNGFHFLLSYTYQKSMLTGYLNNQDTYLRSWIDQYDLPQILTISSGYQLPFFLNSHNQLLKQTLGGWSLNAILTFSSGELFAAPSGVQSTGLSPRISNPTRAHAFNTCTLTVSGTLQNCMGNEQPVWAINQPFTLNNTTPYFGGLRTGIPPNVNLSLFKTFPIYDRLKLQFRAESFNLTNTPQFGAPDINVNDAAFGSLTNFAQTNNSRNIQLALKLSF